MSRVEIRVWTREHEWHGWETNTAGGRHPTPIDLVALIDALESRGVDPGQPFTARIDFGGRVLVVEQGIRALALP